MSALPLFPVTTVGSWPRPPALLRAQRLKRLGRMSAEEFNRLADEAVLEALRLQEEAGVDVVTDGEQRRDNFYSFVSEKLDGVRLMTLAEMLDVVEDKAGFERILRTLDAPAYSISTATCVGKVRRRKPLALDDLRFLKRHSTKAIKVTLPGPYLLTRSMYLPPLSSEAYPTKEDLGEDVVQVLWEEVQALAQEGVDFIQLDEPVLTELVFSQGQTRTFMCAALAARKDPAEELEFALALLNRVVKGISGVRIGLHVCRGNWSQKEETLLSGSYHPLSPYLKQMQVQQLVLEYATQRAGDLVSFPDKELGLGVVNPRLERVETIDDIRRAVERALETYPADKLWLNPDCGFGTFSNRPVSQPEIAARKLANISAVARLLREQG
ncbi:MAG: cobalamin-independent methionine synthase II family protein [Chloroflexi bacterium]|nr:cobalamin-independent methionine synthase II family protein [Chloroflexota bacterium]